MKLKNLFNLKNKKIRNRIIVLVAVLLVIGIWYWKSPPAQVSNIKLIATTTSTMLATISSGGGGGGSTATTTTTTTTLLSWCYQETTNKTNAKDGSCSQNYSGTYTFTSNWLDSNDTWDGSILTYGKENSGWETMWSVYVIPPQATNNSLFNVCDGNITSAPFCVNLTIPTECWSKNLNGTALPNMTKVVVLQASSKNLTYTTMSNWSCMNRDFHWTANYATASYKQLRVANSTNVSERIYEEAMYWRIWS